MKIETAEKRLNRDFKKNTVVLGLDTAFRRTGWCLLTTNDKDVKIEHGFINMDSKDKYYTYNNVIKVFSSLIKPGQKVMIEDTFFRFNANMFKKISRVGAVAYTIAHLKGCKAEYLLATQARKRIGIKATMKKKLVQAQFKKQMKLTLNDEDIIDAMIVAFAGLVEENTVI